MKKLMMLIFLVAISVTTIYAQGCSTVRGLVWYDVNADGIRNDNAALVEDGIKVYLYNANNDELVDSMDVFNGGYYIFDIDCGNYYIKVDKGDYSCFSPKDQGNDDEDSDVNEQGISDVFGLNLGETKYLDVGLTDDCSYSASLKGQVWFDENKNGIQDAGEDGIEGVVVHLIKDGQDTGIAVTTDANGNYEFDNLECGHSYSVKIEKPSSYDDFTTQNSGSDDTIDSDVNSDGISGAVSIDECKTYEDLDAGLIKQPAATYSIGDRVWQDLNKDGIQDTNENGLFGVEVKLLDENGNELATTTTDANGEYKFGNLLPGKYIVEVVKPADFDITKKDIGDDEKDSDFDPVTNKTDLIEITNSDIDTIDAGLISTKRASLKGQVWLDENKNGIQDAGEDGIEGVIVHLIKDGQDTGITTTTDANGNYEFDNLECGYTYSVKIEKPSSYDDFTTQNSGSDDTIDSDVNSDGISDAVSIDECKTYEDLDAGIIKYGDAAIDVEKSTNGVDADTISAAPTLEVGDSVTWEYVVTNSGATTIYDIELKDDKEGLISCPKDTLAAGESMTCSKSGTVVAGEYENIATVTAVADGGQSVTDSDPSHYIGEDSGNGGATSLCLGDRMWLDKNLNGIQDSNELGVVNIGVELYDVNGNLLQSTKTDSNGNYKFCGLTAGEYKVKFEQPNTYLFTKKDIESDVEDSDVNGDGWSDTIILEDKSNYDIDAGIYCECDDYKVNPDNYKETSASTSLSGAFAILIFIFIATFTLKYRENEEV